LEIALYNKGLTLTPKSITCEDDKSDLMDGSFGYDAARSRDDYGGGMFTLGRKHAMLRETAVFCLNDETYRLRVALTRQPSASSSMDESCILVQACVVLEAESEGVSWDVWEGSPSHFPSDAAVMDDTIDVDDDDDSLTDLLPTPHDYLELPGGVYIRCTGHESTVKWVRNGIRSELDPRVLSVTRLYNSDDGSFKQQQHGCVMARAPNFKQLQFVNREHSSP